MPTDVTTIYSILQGGGVLAFAFLVLALLWMTRKEQAARDDRNEKSQEVREGRYVAAMEKQADATSSLAKSITEYAGKQDHVALELRDLTSEVRSMHDELREPPPPPRRDETVPIRRRGNDS